MKQTLLIVRCDKNNENFTVTGTQEKIKAFIKWAAEYNHGTFDGVNTINCNASIDLCACKQKALHESLLSCISKDEIKKKIASM